MSKVNAHYERIDPRNGVRNPVAVVDPFRMHLDNAHCNRIDPRNGVSHSVSGVNPFTMRIYFAHVSGVIEATRQQGLLPGADTVLEPLFYVCLFPSHPVTNHPTKTGLQ